MASTSSHAQVCGVDELGPPACISLATIKLKTQSTQNCLPVAIADVVISAVGLQEVRPLTALEIASRWPRVAVNPFEVPAASRRMVSFQFSTCFTGDKWGICCMCRWAQYFLSYRTPQTHNTNILNISVPLSGAKATYGTIHST